MTAGPYQAFVIPGTSPRMLGPGEAMIDVVASASHIKGRGPQWPGPFKHSFDVEDRPTLALWIGEVDTIAS